MSRTEDTRAFILSLIIGTVVILSLALPLLLIVTSAKPQAITFAEANITATVRSVAPIPVPKPTV